jgi:hypothetical protein
VPKALEEKNGSHVAMGAKEGGLEFERMEADLPYYPEPDLAIN